MDLTLLRQRMLARVSALPVIDRHVYRARHGPARGLRRQGGLGWLPGFVPRSQMWSVEERWLEQLDLTGRVVYDIGGDQGILTLAFARKVGPAGHVVTVEPTPRSAARIRANVRHNDFTDRCTILEAACGEAPGVATLTVPRSAAACASADPAIAAMAQAERGACDVITVPVVTVDQIVAEGHPAPAFLKIDTEGYELPVLRGARATIERHRPLVYLENHGADEEQKVRNARGILEWLAAAGYEARHLETGQPVEPSTARVAARGHIVGVPRGR